MPLAGRRRDGDAVLPQPGGRLGPPLHRLAATPPATTAPTSPPRGPRTPEHLAQNVKAADFALDEATLDRIDALTAPGVDVDPQNRYEIPVPGLTDARLRRR